MMNPQDQKIASFVQARFQKSGSSTPEAGLLEEVSVEVRGFFGSAIVLDDGEIIVLVSLESSSRWSALTTRRLFSTIDNVVKIVAWENIADVVVDFSGLEYSLDAQSKLSEAKIATEDGSEVLVNTSPGQPFVGFWNCLNLAKQMGKEEARRRSVADEQPNNP